MKRFLLTVLRTATVVFYLYVVFGSNRYANGQQPPADLSEASLEQLGDIPVYSASMHLQPSGDAPSSVTVITADEIQEQGYRTLADILKTVRSFYITYDRIYSSVGVRGFARPGDYNTRILLLVDGHRMNDNVYDEAMIGTEFPIDIDMIQRVEIVRGPVSALYGSNALFAVINVITRRPQDLNGFELSTEAGSYNTYKGRISYGYLQNHTGILISGSFVGSRGQNQLYYPEFDTSQNNHGIASHADDDQLGTALAVLTVNDLTLQASYGTREKGIPTGAYDTIFNNSGTRTTDSHGYIDAKYRHTFAGAWDVLARAFVDRYAYQGTYMYPSPLDSSQISPNLDFAEGTWWGTQLQATKTVLKRHQVTIGGEYRDNTRQNQSNHSLNPYSLDLFDKRKSFIGGIYLQDELSISKSLSFNAAIRYDYYSSVKSSIDPRAALLYRPGKNTDLKFIYGEAFRIPNVYEKYYAVFGDLPNPALKPEKIRSAEIVWEQSLTDRIWLSTSAFYIRMNSLITQQATAAGLLIFVNLQNANSDGIEVEVKGRLAKGLEGVASYSFQEAKDRDTGQFLNNSPRHLGKLNLIQPMLHRKLFASLNAQYTGRMTTFGNGSVSPFSMVNVELQGRRIGRHLDLSAGIDNLLDKKYYDPPSTAVSESAIQQDGRTYRLKLTWHLGER
jgi:outer membrane receptor protein involved in Fe transport